MHIPNTRTPLAQLLVAAARTHPLKPVSAALESDFSGHVT